MDEWDRIVGTNLKGTWLTMRAELGVMLAQGAGTVVNVASTLGLRGSLTASPYSASNHGVLGLTRTAAIEYASAGIRVNAVSPGAIDTLDDGRDLRALPGLPRGSAPVCADGPPGWPR